MPEAATGPAAASAPARSPAFALSLDTSFTATDNANSAPDGQREADLIGIVRPRALWHRDTPGLKADVDAAFVFTGSAAGHLADAARPDLAANASATLLPDWLTLDAAARVAGAEADPYGPRVQDTSGANRRLQQSLSTSPLLRHRVARDLTLQLRREDDITWHTSGADTTHVAHATELRLDLEPRPLGATASASRQDSHDRGAPLSTLTLVTVRAGLSYELPAADLVLSADAGRDRVRTALTDHDDPLAALAVRWRPTARTDLSAMVEQRFFGKGGTLTLRHRTPWTSIALGLSREPVLVADSLNGLSGLGGGDLRPALDALLTTRYPDPAARAGVVDALLASRGLQATTAGPVNALASYPQLVTQGTFSWTWTTPRTTYSLAAWGRTAQVLRRHGDPLTALPGFGSDSRQTGCSLQIGHALAPTWSFDALAQASRVSGLAAAQGARSDDRTLRLSLVKTLSARTSASAGTQVERFDSTVPGQPGFRTLLVFAGLTRRF
jgi:uncharacterized protein (PEP-CTERM system associated)